MKISEVELIRRIRYLNAPFQKNAQVGIGDDTAVLKGKEGYSYLFTTDTLVENVHFKWKFSSPSQIGWKALAVNISDIAAMGGYPLFALVTLGIPISTLFSTIKQVYEGILNLSSKLNMEISGGDVVRSPTFFISISILGEVESGRAILRSGAKPGDSLYLTGDIGAAACGLLCFNQKDNVLEPSIRKFLEEKWLTPFPRVKEAREIVAKGFATAMIDTSDGLSSDLYHILEESKVGAQIWEKSLPIAPETRESSLKLKKSPVEIALQGGEDYELLFTASSAVDVEKSISFPVSKIGKIVSEPGLLLVDEKGQKKKLKPEGWDHFSSPG